ncbi:MAG: tyrosine-type recombinase/integrase [Syntrophales bacterium]|nr:tyrosine-type recombinase/integrase [Syntrophales bacterium]
MRKFYAAIRGVLHHAWRLGQMSADDYQRAIDLGKVGGDTLPAGRYITPDEFAALIRACIADPVVPAGVRDAAILGVLYFEGLRRSEVISLNTEDYDPDTGRTLIHGKGRKPRIAYLTNGAAAALADWFVVRGVEPGPIFMAIRRWGQVQGGRITSQTIYNMITKRSQEAGIDKISPHDFRRSSVSNMLLAGNDLLIVAKIHGHADPKTTARYDLRPEQQMSVAASSVAMEYERRFPVSVLPIQGETG